LSESSIDLLAPADDIPPNPEFANLLAIPKVALDMLPPSIDEGFAKFGWFRMLYPWAAMLI
jgi:hypothetical protein